LPLVVWFGGFGVPPEQQCRMNGGRTLQRVAQVHFDPKPTLHNLSLLASLREPPKTLAKILVTEHVQGTILSPNCVQSKVKSKSQMFRILHGPSISLQHLERPTIHIGLSKHGTCCKFPFPFIHSRKIGLQLILRAMYSWKGYDL